MPAPTRLSSSTSTQVCTSKSTSAQALGCLLGCLSGSSCQARTQRSASSSSHLGGARQAQTSSWSWRTTTGATWTLQAVGGTGRPRSFRPQAPSGCVSWNAPPRKASSSAMWPRHGATCSAEAMRQQPCRPPRLRRTPRLRRSRPRCWVKTTTSNSHLSRLPKQPPALPLLLRGHHRLLLQQGTRIPRCRTRVAHCKHYCCGTSCPVRPSRRSRQLMVTRPHSFPLFGSRLRRWRAQLNTQGVRCVWQEQERSGKLGSACGPSPFGDPFGPTFLLA